MPNDGTSFEPAHERVRGGPATLPLWGTIAMLETTCFVCASEIWPLLCPCWH